MAWYRYVRVRMGTAVLYVMYVCIYVCKMYGCMCNMLLPVVLQ